MFAALTTDCFMRLPPIQVAEARLEAGAADTWMYRFDYESPSFAGRLGATHAVELPYVFYLLDDEFGTGRLAVSRLPCMDGCEMDGCERCPVSAEDCGIFVAAVRASHGLHHPWLSSLPSWATAPSRRMPVAAS